MWLLFVNKVMGFGYGGLIVNVYFNYLLECFFVLYWLES